MRHPNEQVPGHLPTEDFNGALHELRDCDARLYLRTRLYFYLPILLLPVPIVPRPARALSNSQRGAHGRSRQRRAKRHAQAGAGTREELPWCAATFWHEPVEACGTLCDGGVSWWDGANVAFVSASLCGCRNIGGDGDVPVIHMGMIVGRRGVSISIRPLKGGGP